MNGSSQWEVMTRSFKAAVFLDRDGTLNVERHYLHKPDELELIDGVIEGLQLLQQANFQLFVVTNQSGIGRGYFAEEDMRLVHRKLEHILESHGINLAHIYFAPEAPGEPSRGRKPSPQFLLDASRDYQISLEHSYMIGDKQCDLDCGWAAGVAASVLVRTGYGADLERGELAVRGSFHVADDLLAAAHWIRQSETQ